MKINDIVIIHDNNIWEGCSGTIKEVRDSSVVIEFPDDKTRLAFLKSEIEVYKQPEKNNTPHGKMSDRTMESVGIIERELYQFPFGHDEKIEFMNDSIALDFEENEPMF